MPLRPVTAPRGETTGRLCLGRSRNYDKVDSTYDAAMFFTSGGFYIYTNNSGAAKSSGVYVQTNGNAWVAVSDSTQKENFQQINGYDLLEKVGNMPITRWSYKSEGTGIEHIGPMAQDFYAAFKLGNDDKGISTVDADGVALAAIQELYRQNKELYKQNAELQKQIEELRQELKKK